MKVGDLVGFKNVTGVPGRVSDKLFLIMRTQDSGLSLKVWIYPDPDEGYDHTDDLNYYYDHYFEVVSESR